MTLRQNVRNFMVGLSISEVRIELAGAVERGETRRAGYIEEWLCELEEENALYGDDDDWADGDDCITPVAWR